MNTASWYSLHSQVTRLSVYGTLDRTYLGTCLFAQGHSHLTRLRLRPLARTMNHLQPAMIYAGDFSTHFDLTFAVLKHHRLCSHSRSYTMVPLCATPFSRTRVYTSNSWAAGLQKTPKTAFKASSLAKPAPPTVQSNTADSTNLYK